MTPEFAQELADAFCGGDPTAVVLLHRMFEGLPPDRARAKVAVKALWPAVLGEIPEAEQGPPPKRLRYLGDGARAALDELERYTAGDNSGRVTTGMAELDKRLRGGLRGGQMTLLGAPTGAGKTTLVQQIAVAAAQQQRGAVLFVSPEMSLESLAEREIIRRSEYALWQRGPHVRDMELRDRAERAHAEVAAEIHRERLPILVLEELSVTMAGIETVARAAGKLALIVIDYAQYVAGDSSREVARYLQVGEVAERSVELAIKLSVPVLVASQVNTHEERGRTTYTFRESKILEQHAHTVMILDVQWKDSDSGTRKVERADIICTKNRGFATFRMRVEYTPELYQVADYVERTCLPDYSVFDPTPPMVPR